MISEIRSTLNFAEKEGYQTRSVLVAIFKDKDRVMESIEHESKEYLRLAGSEAGSGQLSKAFSSEMIYHLEKSVKRLGRETVSQ